MYASIYMMPSMIFRENIDTVYMHEVNQNKNTTVCKMS